MGDTKFTKFPCILNGLNHRIGKLLSSTLLWCCLFFNFTQFVVLENLLVFDLALSGVNGLSFSREVGVAGPNDKTLYCRGIPGGIVTFPSVHDLCELFCDLV